MGSAKNTSDRERRVCAWAGPVAGLGLRTPTPTISFGGPPHRWNLPMSGQQHCCLSAAAPSCAHTELSFFPANLPGAKQPVSRAASHCRLALHPHLQPLPGWQLWIPADFQVKKEHLQLFPQVFWALRIFLRAPFLEQGMPPVAMQMSTDIENTKSSHSPSAIHDKAYRHFWPGFGGFFPAFLGRHD